MDAKKKTLNASERNEELRAGWRENVPANAIQQFVFIDESGSNRSYTPLLGWAPKGERAVGSVPRNHGPNTTLLGALSCSGVQAAMTIEGAADALTFEAFLEHILIPSLKPTQIVVMDNLSIHKGHRVRQLIEEAGCQLLFLPPYSPDFSPIEPMWSKLKSYLRRIGARTQAALDQAISDGLRLITEQDAIGWFKHCGYEKQAQC